MHLCRSALQRLAPLTQRSSATLLRNAPVRQMSASSVPGSAGSSLPYYLFVGVTTTGAGVYVYRHLTRDSERHRERDELIEKHRVQLLKGECLLQSAEVSQCYLFYLFHCIAPQVMLAAITIIDFFLPIFGQYNQALYFCISQWLCSVLVCVPVVSPDTSEPYTEDAGKPQKQTCPWRILLSLDKCSLLELHYSYSNTLKGKTVEAEEVSLVNAVEIGIEEAAAEEVAVQEEVQVATTSLEPEQAVTVTEEETSPAPAEVEQAVTEEETSPTPAEEEQAVTEDEISPPAPAEEEPTVTVEASTQQVEIENVEPVAEDLPAETPPVLEASSDNIPEELASAAAEQEDWSELSARKPEEAAEESTAAGEEVENSVEAEVSASS
ncbi:protein MGARP [Hyperolius riggenbachi]|uniref:protein MGARP n=1 Tax=Hyperolius riggenbachi TaxID=752182 RepID=UPI0035A2C02E